VLTERWRVHYNTVRPHSSLGYRSPAPEAWLTEASQVWKKWKAKNASHFPTPRLRRRVISYHPFALHLTISLVQKIGRPLHCSPIRTGVAGSLNRL